MPGETNLQKLIQGMKPKLNQGEFVFCTLASMQTVNTLDPLCMFQEEEGITVIISKQKADDCSAPLLHGLRVDHTNRPFFA